MVPGTSSSPIRFTLNTRFLKAPLVGAAPLMMFRTVESRFMPTTKLRPAALAAAQVAATACAFRRFRVSWTTSVWLPKAEMAKEPMMPRIATLMSNSKREKPDRYRLADLNLINSFDCDNYIQSRSFASSFYHNLFCYHFLFSKLQIHFPFHCPSAEQNLAKTGGQRLAPMDDFHCNAAFLDIT